MNKAMYLIFIGFILTFFNTSSFATSTITSANSTSSKIIQQTSIPFIKNLGQIDSKVAYYAKTFAGTVFINKEGKIIYSLPLDAADKNTAWVIEEALINKRSISPVGSDKVSSTINIFNGASKNGQNNIPGFANINLFDAYPGIDVRINAKASNIEKLFIIQPHSDPGQIKLSINGGDKLSINEKNQLVVSTSAGDIVFTAPVAFQEINNKKVTIDVAYVVQDNQYGFKLGNYDKSKELVIDPLIASTFLGGNNTNAISDFEFVGDIVEKDGFVYIAGTTDSSDFPTNTGFVTYDGGVYDGFVAKLDANLSTLVAATFLGGSSYDDISGIALDEAGNVYVAGRSGGGDFPFVAGGYQFYPDLAAGTFIAKLSNDLSSLLATSFVAGNSLPGKLALGNNSIYLIGRTNSPNVPVTPDALDTTCGGDGACDPSGSFNITKYYGYAIRQDLNLTSILAATYLGRGGDRDIGVGSNSNVYVISLSDAILPTRLTAMDANFTTQISQLSYDRGSTFTAFDLNDEFLVAVGNTTQADLPVTPNAFDTTCGTDGACNPTGSTNYPTSDNFITKVSLDLQTTLALTYFGGSSSDILRAIKIDSDGNIVVGGSTNSDDIPTSTNAFDQTLNGNQSGYIAKLNGSLTSLLYGSYIGGSNGAYGDEIATAANGMVYLAGNTGSTDFPVTNGAFETTYNGGDNDVFVSLFNTKGIGGGGENQAPIADAGSDQFVNPRTTVYLDGGNSYDPDGNISSYSWRQVSGKGVSLKNTDTAIAKFRAPGVKRGQTKTLTFELTVIDDDGASASSQVAVTVSR